MNDPRPGSQLIQRFLDGVTSDTEIHDIELRLADDPKFADEFVESVTWEERMRDVFARPEVVHSAEETQSKLTTSRQQPIRRVVGLSACAAALLAAFAFIWQQSVSAAYQHEVLSGRIAVETIEQSGFNDGDTLRVIGNSPATLRLQDGSRVEMSEQSEAVVETSKVQLVTGKGVFRLPTTKMVVATHGGDVHGLNSEFSVEVREHTALSVNVPTQSDMLVSVIKGTVYVDHDDDTHALSLGDQRVFSFTKRDVRRPPDMTGRLTDVSADGRQMTLEISPHVKGEPPKSETIKLDRSTKLAFANVPVDGAMPTVGYRTMVWLIDGESKLARWIRFQGTSSPQNVAVKRQVVLMNSLDLNGDGMLAREELPESQKAMFSQWDLDDDGFLNRQEWLKSRNSAKQSKGVE